MLGLAQYLTKFLPRLASITRPLQELIQKVVAWTWDHVQQAALDALKVAATSTPVLRYYNLNEEVTLQCDASRELTEAEQDMHRLKESYWP